MSLEKAISDLQAAVEANTAALLGAKSAGTSETKSEPKTTKTAKAAAKEEPASEFTREQMQAALTTLKERDGPPAAKALIKKYGKVDKMADIADEDIDATYKAAAKLLEDDGDM